MCSSDLDFDGRGRRLDEMIDILRALWTGEVVEHQGDCYTIPPVHMAPAPPAPIKVMIGGNSEPALRRAVRNDGWIGAYTTIESADKSIQKLRRLREDDGRADSPFSVAFASFDLDFESCAALARAGATAVMVSPSSLSASESIPGQQESVAAFATRLRELSGSTLTA